jgi:hypothetical protein
VNLASQGGDPAASFGTDDRQRPEAVRALQEADIKKLWPLIKEFGIKAE